MVLVFNNLIPFIMKNRFFITKKTNAIAWVMALLLASISLTGRSQDQNPSVFAVVEYMKVKQGDEQKYIDLERNYWKKIHQERVNNGEIVRWVLYEVKTETAF
jgi:hypothetical protein